MPDFDIVIKNKSVLDVDRAKKVSVSIRGVTFVCDLPSSYAGPSSAHLSTRAKGSFGSGLQWFKNAGSYAAGEVAVSVTTVNGVLTGSNALPSYQAVNRMKIKVDHHANPPVTVTFS